MLVINFSNLENIVDRFLCPRILGTTSVLLLGLSGGPDSLALFHILHKLQPKLKFNLHVAHVDHRWREESALEADALQQLVTQYGYPFHLHVLDPQSISGNLEAECRRLRLEFFSRVAKEFHCCSILLGHHADDLAETVCKRIFEGASFLGLEGISGEKSLGDVLVWRPFLKVRKRVILDYIKKEQLNPFEDGTNFDSKFLRGRMRVSILPGLSQSFGKEIVNNLIALGEEAKEVREYIEPRVQIWMRKMVDGHEGAFIDFSEDMTIAPLELRYIIKKLGQREGKNLSRSFVNQIIVALQTNKANLRFEGDELKIYVDRQRIFIQKKHLHEVEGEIKLDMKVHCLTQNSLKNGVSLSAVAQSAVENPIYWEGWKIYARPGYFERESSWRDVWFGKCSIVLPYGDYILCRPKVKERYGEEGTLDSWWSDHKVPAFLRYLCPVIYCDKKLFYECLTGRTPRHLKRPSEGCMELLLERETLI